jgi:hypothetical protein
MPKPRDLTERFWEKVAKSDGCWLWIGGRTSRGYGMFTARHRRQRGAHRYAWEMVNGPIPDGMVICHRCDNPPCVRVDHLFLGTQKDNIHDMMAKHRGATRGGGYTSPRLMVGGECNNGHTITADLIYRKGTSLLCRTCKRESDRRWWHGSRKQSAVA